MSGATVGAVFSSTTGVPGEVNELPSSLGRLSSPTIRPISLDRDLIVSSNISVSSAAVLTRLLLAGSGGPSCSRVKPGKPVVSSTRLLFSSDIGILTVFPSPCTLSSEPRVGEDGE